MPENTLPTNERDIQIPVRDQLDALKGDYFAIAIRAALATKAGLK